MKSLKANLKPAELTSQEVRTLSGKMLEGFDMISIAAIIAALLMTGVLAGIAAGMLGIGGGIIIVPLLFALMNFIGIENHRMHISIATSLAVIFITGIEAIYFQYKYGFISKRLLKIWGGGAFTGAILGVFISNLVDGSFLRIFFGTFCIFIAFMMFFLKKDAPVLTDEHMVTPHKKAQLFVSFLIGVVATMLGIGGGTLSVPGMTAFGIDMFYATATSSAITMLVAAPGTIGYIVSGWSVPDLPPLSFGYLNLPMFVIISIGSLAATPLGTIWAHKVNQKVLRRLFALVIFLSGLKMIF